MTIYYNENDLIAAQWLLNLIAAGHIAPGVVDTRSIEDVRPDDLREFDQCHFFAGVGVWSYALRAAGWADDRPVWTGSCPCQPFSAAGEGAGFADERHLWPAFYHLISGHKKWCEQQKRPTPIILGEQVASKDADPWIDLVHADLEALGYAFGAIPFPSAGVGAPHIRDRLYWVANADDPRLEGRSVLRKRFAQLPTGAGGVASRMADTQNGGRGEECSDARGLVTGDSAQGVAAGLVPGGADSGPGPANGFWRSADWIGCTDSKWRPVEPGTFPLAHGAAARVGRLRAYGNAINAEAARAWIECVMEAA